MASRIRIAIGCSVFLSILMLILLFSIYREAICMDKRYERLSARIERYNNMRRELLVHERYGHVGGQMELSVAEMMLNQQLMNEKEREYIRGLAEPCQFKPAQHFFHVYKNISASPLFDLLETMPKGGALHVHDMALCSTDYLVELSYREHLWICIRSSYMEKRYDGVNEKRFEKLFFSREKPKDEISCSWQLLEELRRKHGAEQVDLELRACLTLYPYEKFMDINEAWRYFGRIFGLVYGLLTYAPVWRDYFHRALHEFYKDGVQYLEIRTALPKLYDLEGNNYTQLQTACIMREESFKFLRTHADFIGSKMIYAPSRNVTDKIIDTYLDTAKELQQTYPDYFAGLDLVGQEDGIRPLKSFAPKLLSVIDDIDFYFNAGETNWFDTPSDENIIDAVLLGTKRIGHSFGLLKHPEVLRHVLLKDIAIEVNPISNQVMQLLSDFRNHPAAHLLAHNYPVVISSDNPSYWKASPLTHDFYITFVGIASKTADLGLLKKLAWNSLKYSALTQGEKEVAFAKFMQNWHEWVQKKIANGL